MPRSNLEIFTAPEQQAKPERRRLPASRGNTDKVKSVDRRINTEISLGPFTLDDRRKLVYVKGAEKRLSPKLFELLKTFISNPGKVLSPAELATKLWPFNEDFDPEDVKQYVYLLRKAIEPNPANPRWLRNVRGFGYQLVID